MAKARWRGKDRGERILLRSEREQLLSVSVGQCKEPGFRTVHIEEPLWKGALPLSCDITDLFSNALPGCSVEERRTWVKAK